MDKAMEQKIVSIINDIDDMSIATVREDGFPQATTVSYMNEGLFIYFLTVSNSQKALNIIKNNKVSLTINRSYKSWNDIQGLSIGGLAYLVSDPVEQGGIGKLLLEKFPQVAQYETGNATDLAFFRIEPKAISVLDYRQSFGHTELILL